MSVLSTPIVADAIARFMNGAKPRLKPELLFDEIPGDRADLVVPTRHGDVAATLYRPAVGAPSGLYVNLHGGGYVVRSPEQDDPWCRYLAANAGVFVLNVDYDVAPGARFPVSVEEAYDVLVWAAQPGHEWDGTRLAIGGQSAGGGIEAGAARLAHELGTPKLALQVLHYPPLDLATSAKDKPAPQKDVVIKPFMGEIFDTAYVPDVAQRRDRLVSPAWEGNLGGLEGMAPAMVVTCGIDRLREEGVRYAHALDEAGALRQHLDLEGLDHGYNILTTRAAAERGYEPIAARVREAIG